MNIDNAFPAIRVLQPLGEFYLTALPADLLLKVCFTDPLTINENNRLTGNQRRQDPRRIKAISQYLQTQDAALPGTIILAANCTQEGEILDPGDESKNKLRWTIKSNDGNTREVVSMEIPTDEKLAAVVDGQHRLWGFETVPNELKKIPIPCAVFFDLPTPQQAAIFATINFNQKPVSKSQSYELFGYNLDEESEKSWSPDKLAVFFTRKLNVAEESPFKNHIKVAAQDDRVLDEIAKERQKEWSISTATIVEGILSLISTNPKKDRDMLHKDPVESRSRKKLKDMQSSGAPPFRDLYLAEDRDIVIYKTLINFFSAVDKVFWSKPNSGLIRKTAGIQALFCVLKELLPEQLEKADLQKDTWEAVLRNAETLNFSNIQVFESSGRGRNRIKDAILVCLGKKHLDNISDENFRTYLENKITKR